MKLISTLFLVCWPFITRGMDPSNSFTQLSCDKVSLSTLENSSKHESYENSSAFNAYTYHQSRIPHILSLLGLGQCFACGQTCSTITKPFCCSEQLNRKIYDSALAGQSHDAKKIDFFNFSS